MKQFGLIGHPVSHSFSKKYFIEKFEKEHISGCSYELYDLLTIEKLPELIQSVPNLLGLNVTIPHKQAVIPFLHEIDASAKEIGAVNVIKITNGKLKGFNSDYYGFKQSLLNQIKAERPHALVLGTGGASKAVAIALRDLGISFQYVSRTKSAAAITYQNLNEGTFNEYKLIINTTPLGTSPNTSLSPAIPYQYLTGTHFLHDLVYNPAETLFMKKGLKQGASVKNGLEMLILQAEKSWEIWNK